MKELKKTITVWEGLALAISMVVGSGLLGLPGITIEANGIYASAVGWVITPLTIIPLIYIFVKLGLRFPSSGGLSKYAQESVGEWAGYAVTSVLSGTFTIGIPALALIGGAYIQRFLSLPTESIPWLAIIILALTTFVNLAGVKISSVVNTASLAALISLVVLIIALNISYVSSGLKVVSDVFFDDVKLSYYQSWSACALIFWAFIGWENLSFGLEEFKNPQKSIPKVYWLSFIMVTFLYLILALVTIGADATGLAVVGASGLVSLFSKSILSSFVVSVMILIILANANAWVFGASRLIYASGREKILPSYLGRLSINGIPYSSLLSLFFFYVSFILVSNYANIKVSTLILLVNQNFLVLYGFSIAAYWKTEQGWSCWVITITATMSCVFFLAGFTWWLVYPTLLMAMGYLAYHRRGNSR